MLILDDLGGHRYKFSAELYVRPEVNCFFLFFLLFVGVDSFHLWSCQVVGSTLIVLWLHFFMLPFLSRSFCYLWLAFYFRKGILRGWLGCLVQLLVFGLLKFFWFFGMIRKRVWFGGGGSRDIIRFALLSWHHDLIHFYQGCNLRCCRGIQSWNSVCRTPAAKFKAVHSNLAIDYYL